MPLPEDDTWPAVSLRHPRYSQSLQRGLAILSCFTAERCLLGIAELAEELDMNPSTTHRYASTLAALGYLEQDDSRKYRLGLRVTDLGLSALSGSGLREHAYPFLKGLARETSCSVSVTVLDGTDIRYVERLQGSLALRRGAELELGSGSRLPAYCTAMGKVLLAHLPDNEMRLLLAPIGLSRRAPNTIVSKKKLQRELEEVEAAGFAVNDEELAPELIAIAAPVRNSAGDVAAAVGVSAHSSIIPLPQMVDALGPHLLSTAAHISARRGYRPPDQTL
jgi:IclR family pca regulon transcriptional regulator